MRLLFVGLCAALLWGTVPLLSSALTIEQMQAQIQALLAQIAILQNQLKNPPAATPQLGQCPVFTRTLERNMRSDDVKVLQMFLRSEGVFKSDITGYFGVITERAVQDWQSIVGIVTFGSPATNGWGVVGPKTREKILQVCIAKLPLSEKTATTPSCPATASTTPPSVSCGVKWELVRDEKCNVTWRCAIAAKAPNRPPALLDILGPTSIAAGVQGVWALKASDPDGDSLSYSISWGETGSLGSLEKIAGSTAFTASNSFSHIYYSTGSYIISAKVRDPSGREAGGTLQLKVLEPSDPTCGADCVAPQVPLVVNSMPTGNDLLFVPQGVTHCITPWGGKLVPSGNMVAPEPYFKGSAPTSVPTLKCVSGKWFRCDAAGSNCISHVPPATNPTMAGLQSYMAIVGSSCGTHLSTKTVKANAGSLICKDFAGAPGVCAMAQEETAIGLHCAHINWAEDLTF